jgi:mRNA interferase MazF
MQRGEIWWAELPDPAGSAPGYRRPVVVIQANRFTRTRIKTVMVLILTSFTDLAAAPGNALIRKQDSSLSMDSVANVTQVYTVDRSMLVERVGTLPTSLLRVIENGLRIVLEL